MSDDHSRLGSRLIDFALTILLAAMALYGAVAILRSIWLPLCAVAAAMGGIGVVGWVLHVRFRRW